MTTQDPLNTTVYQDYLLDLGILVKEIALEAKKEATKSSTDFAFGYMAGFHRVVSLMQQQAEAFGIPLKEIGLDEIDPNDELV